MKLSHAFLLACAIILGTTGCAGLFGNKPQVQQPGTVWALEENGIMGYTFPEEVTDGNTVTVFEHEDGTVSVFAPIPNPAPSPESNVR